MVAVSLAVLLAVLAAELGLFVINALLCAWCIVVCEACVIGGSPPKSHAFKTPVLCVCACGLLLCGPCSA